MPIYRWMPGLPAGGAFVSRLAAGLALVLWSAFAAAAAFAAAPAPAASPPMVVASIAPVHSLVAAVMQGVGEPRLLVPGGSSPHAHALRPSDARAIESAVLLVWVGPGLENFLERPLASLARPGADLRLVDTPGLRLLPLREAPDAADGGGSHRHDHGPASGRVQGGDRVAEGIDMHLWLDPANAGLMASRIGERLAAIDPPNAETYRRNAAELRRKLVALDEHIARQLTPFAGRDFIVFHDGFQYFENRYGLAPAGILTLNPEVSPGAERVRRLRARIAAGGVACVFIEPQFSSAIADTLVEGTGARVGRLDPLGANIAPGPGLYPQLLEAMARSFQDCMTPPAEAG